ncbi:sporulation protein YqfD [Rummeliibacillus suwonensis]|jgi:similar to stage IV sporulation protein|uniref:sporulation protein YqfD n=1 Tax=Rummeliibacillus suwonensis TaxID=1306154 RepID=UPI001AAE92EA|nr:sporulation protein YqfD [Rummeliibacillus suwonensis]MBO2534926.1 sporulation protein YqfD [Rummeliibacillus suwonensis]
MKKSREYRIVRIRIKRTKRLPAFLTALTKNKIALHHLTTTDNEVSFHTIRKHLPTIRKLRYQYGISFRIESLDDDQVLRKEWIVYVGLLILFAIPFFFSQWIWQVSVENATPEQSEELSETLHEMHLAGPFMKRNKPDDSLIRQYILSKHRDLSWVHIHRRGSKIIFEPLEAPVIENEVNNDSIKGNLIANKSGVITHFNLLKGERVVEENDAVKNGQLLVSGVIKSGEDSIVYGAEGEVYADYWIESAFSLPKKITYQTMGEKTYHFRWANEKKSENAWKIVKLPKWFSMIGEVYLQQELIEKQVTLDEKSVEDIVIPLLHQRYIKDLPPKTVVKREKLLNVTFDNDTVKGKVLFLVNENIAIKQAINQGD